MKSDYFSNLRDITKYSRQKIKENMIFRSSDLSAYANDPVLYHWLKEKGIKTIIDLRNKKEVLCRSYPEDILKSVNYRNLKLVSDETDERIKGRNNIEFYQWVLENEGGRIREILEILVDKGNFPLIIHCYLGMDRTGIIIALILMLLNASWQDIVDDYMGSGFQMKRELIEFIYQKIIILGGIENYLGYIGLSKKNQKKIQKIIMFDQ